MNWLLGVVVVVLALFVWYVCREEVLAGDVVKNGVVENCLGVWLHEDGNWIKLEVADVLLEPVEVWLRGTPYRRETVAERWRRAQGEPCDN